MVPTGQSVKRLASSKNQLEAALGGDGLESLFLPLAGSQKTADTAALIRKEQAAQYKKAARVAAQDYSTENQRLAKKAIAGKLTEETCRGWSQKMPVKDLNACGTRRRSRHRSRSSNLSKTRYGRISGICLSVHRLMVGDSASPVSARRLTRSGQKRPYDFGDEWRRLQNVTHALAG